MEATIPCTFSSLVSPRNFRVMCTMLGSTGFNPGPTEFRSLWMYLKLAAVSRSTEIKPLKLILLLP
jgi:hypothetical protein